MFAELSKAFIFQKFTVKFYFGLSLHIFQHGLSLVHHRFWKMSATPGACIKPGLVRPLLCHKVNLPSCVARSAAVVSQSKSTELCSSAPQSKSTEM